MTRILNRRGSTRHCCGVFILSGFLLSLGVLDLVPPKAVAISTAELAKGVSLDTMRRVGAWANQGDGAAQLELAVIYQLDRKWRDLAQARRYFTLAAAQGYAAAQYMAGRFAYGGRGGARDYEEAFRWFHAAAEQGHRGAQAQLGLLYHRFHYRPSHLVLAYKYASLGGDRLHLDRLERDMTIEQILEAQKLAGEWEPSGRR